MVEKLAPELIDAIVEQVAEADEWRRSRAEDRQNLQACALTARRFLAPSQRYLFRYFTLKTQRIEDICPKLISNPTLVSYIRNLHLFIWPKHRHRESSGQLLVSFLSLLSRLERLLIHWSHHTPDWDSLPVTLRAAFSGSLFLPTLRCFGIDACPSVPASLLRYAVASFEEVVLLNIGIDEDDQFSPFTINEVSNHNPVLKRLLVLPSGSMRGQDNTLKTSLLDERSATFLTNLQYLELRLANGGTLDGFQEIALSCAGSIQHLAIDFNDFRHKAIDPLPHMGPAIRVLTVMCRMRWLGIPTPFRKLVCTLPVCMPGLEVVNLVLDSHHLRDSDQPQRADMDQALRNLPHLREFHFTISCDHDEAGIEDCFRKAFPVANGAGLLSFKIYRKYFMASRSHNMYKFVN